MVVPRFPDRDGRVAGPAAPHRAPAGSTRIVERAGGDRVLVCDLENEESTPIYVHAKICIVDDVWLMVGSDNMNRRSWTHDSELSCSILDDTPDEREPRDPAGLGDGARRLARDTRLQLWREHLGRTEADGVDDLLDPDRAFAEFRRDRAGARRVARTAVESVLDRPVMCASTNRTASRSGTRGGRTRCRAVVNDPDGRSLRHRACRPLLTDRSREWPRIGSPRDRVTSSHLRPGARPRVVLRRPAAAGRAARAPRRRARDAPGGVVPFEITARHHGRSPSASPAAW